MSRRSVAALVAASEPDLSRPRLSLKLEAMLHDTDRERAACYASMEDLSAQLALLANSIDADSEPVGIRIGREEGWEEDSLVTNLASITRPPTS